MRIPLIVVGCSAHVIEDHICSSFFAGELSYHDACAERPLHASWAHPLTRSRHVLSDVFASSACYQITET